MAGFEDNSSFVWPENGSVALSRRLRGNRSVDGSSAFHTYRDTGHPFIWVISEDHDTHSYCRAFGSGAVTTCFHDEDLSRQNSRWRALSFEIYFALMTIKQWDLFSVSHQLWPGTSIYVILIAKRLAVERSLPVLTT